MDNEQDTGNHKMGSASDANGADCLGDTRAGAENVEPLPSGKARRAGSWIDETSGQALDTAKENTVSDVEP